MPSARGGKSEEKEANLFPDSSIYEKTAMIGMGAYGTVFKARDRTNPSQNVALKRVRWPSTEKGIPRFVIREIALLRQLEAFQHPNVVRLLDIRQERGLEQEMQMYLTLVFEYVEQDLFQYMDRCPPPGLSPDRIKDLMWQTLCGVDFLHSNRIIHRDLKPQNLLVTETGQLKLADFGKARVYDFHMMLTPVVTTLWYRAPEVLLNSPYASPVDMWSCGCIFAELFRRKPLFPGQSEVDQLSKIFRVLGKPREEDWPRDVYFPWSSFPSPVSPPTPLSDLVPEIDPQGLSLLQRMLKFVPEQRGSAAEALVQPYFRDDGYVPFKLTTCGSGQRSSSLPCRNDGEEQRPCPGIVNPFPDDRSRRNLIPDLTKLVIQDFPPLPSPSPSNFSPPPPSSPFSSFIKRAKRQMQILQRKSCVII
ncbi:unnamed protein product [Darwinula stevensoni]|uniref:cyclin-dependent kinase n=1 Tax=Darwinula stevensoni TaxID=69355 RepID=A0A7R8X9W5_9CRUS|nr:unnamed protein product [Darwinula stevensoni]CAG0889577.1 unnamed protein product [Darwinula stevensoni]